MQTDESKSPDTVPGGGGFRGPSPTPSKRVGTTIAGRYRLTSLLGVGGAGAVYEAEHLVTRRVVAVKVLLQDRNVPAAAAARFVREARAAAQSGHECIIDILDAGQDVDGSHFIVMERLHGEDLADCLERDTRLTLDESVDRVCDVLEALEAAHESGIIHRDIKPGNIFLAKTRGGRPRTIVLDFGIAKQNDGDTTGITKKGMTVGTPVYMSPEQVRADGPPDRRTDVWAVGVLLYQCLSGELPFDDANIHKLWVAILSDAHIPLTERVPTIPAEVSRVVDRALAKARDDRFASATEMRDALLRAVGRPQAAGRTHRTTQRRAAAPTVPGETGSTLEFEFAEASVSAGQGDGAASDGERASWNAAAGVPRRVQVGAAVVALVAVFGGFLLLQPGEPDTVSLQFTDLPDDARVFVDGREVDTHGIRWPTGHASILIAAEAQGHERRELLVTPDADRTLRLSLEPTDRGVDSERTDSVAQAAAPRPKPAVDEGVKRAAAPEPAGRVARALAVGADPLRQARPSVATGVSRTAGVSSTAGASRAASVSSASSTGSVSSTGSASSTGSRQPVARRPRSQSPSGRAAGVVPATGTAPAGLVLAGDDE